MSGLRTPMWRGGVSAALLLAAACGGASAAKPPVSAKGEIGLGAKPTDPAADRCKLVPGREASEYDTSGDGRADVRKVHVAINAGIDSRTVMICRQSDVNADGKKDVTRYYDDDGRSLREESDRDFDGVLDRALVFQDGQLFAEELDENHDGKVDTKIFFEKGKPSRAERDLAGRSDATQWRPDRWEYYEAGHMVRMGTDLDGDSRVDRWDRDTRGGPLSAPAQTSAGTQPEAGAAADSLPPAP